MSRFTGEEAPDTLACHAFRPFQLRRWRLQTSQDEILDRDSWWPFPQWGTPFQLCPCAQGQDANRWDEGCVFGWLLIRLLNYVDAIRRDDWPIDNFSEIFLVRSIIFYCIIWLDSLSVFSLISSLFSFTSFSRNFGSDNKVRACTHIC